MAALSVGAAGLAFAGTAEAMLGQPAAEAIIRNVDGASVGSLRIEHRDSSTPRITVAVRGLPAGYHGFHIHTTGVCDPRSIDPNTGSPFFSAGGHFNLGTGSHPDHSGDLPPLLVGADGTGSASFVTDRFRAKQLLDTDGSAVIVHARPDNQANIPDRYHSADDKSGPDADTLKTGDAGARLACGVIKNR
ncbi:superoxide dismutase [Cu-Zn] [Sphaerisporangium siamense]|nr:superoxide dismutase [Cu-Zn] [Sphaerisporangium siamense]